jgi:hypothetical protein
MDIFASIKRAIGLEDDAVAVEGVDDIVAPLAELEFMVVLRGGARGRRVRELRVSLEEERLIHFDPRPVGGEYKFWETVVRTIVPLPQAFVPPGGELRLPVRLPLPELEPSGQLRRYCLCVVAEARGFNPRARAPVVVVALPDDLRRTVEA